MSERFDYTVDTGFCFGTALVAAVTAYLSPERAWRAWLGFDSSPDASPAGVTDSKTKKLKYRGQLLSHV